jgi:hypothetical protein
VSSKAISLKQSPLVLVTGILAFLWVVARACVQSLTIDEADTYMVSVWRPSPSHWDPSANNHVLNSMLMRLFTSIFGASTFTLRIPALLGAALFLIAAYYLVRLMSPRPLLQWSLFLCLTSSPFVMDYLVAARGYSLASAFLLSMIALALWYHAQNAEGRQLYLRRTCMLISLCGALSISANFSFAIADAFTALGLLLWICRERRRDYTKTVVYFMLPGAAAAYFLVGSVLLAWPKGQFTWGADSLLKMIKSLVNASLFQPNEYLLNPRLHHSFVHFGTFLYPLLAAFVLWRIVTLALTHRIGAPAAVSGLVLVAALVAHQVLYSAFGILLPLDRTAMWVVVLFFVLAGSLAASPLDSFPGRISAKALVFILGVIAIYNLGCLRLTYFNEWKYDAAMKDVYAVLSSYNQKYGLTKVSTNWRYVAALNCYRMMSGRETLDQIPGAPGEVNYYPPGYQAYVFFYPVDEGFYKREGLKLVFHDSFSDAAVAIRPEVESQPLSHP